MQALCPVLYTAMVVPVAKTKSDLKHSVKMHPAPNTGRKSTANPACQDACLSTARAGTDQQAVGFRGPPLLCSHHDSRLCGGQCLGAFRLLPGEGLTYGNQRLLATDHIHFQVPPDEEAGEAQQEQFPAAARVP